MADMQNRQAAEKVDLSLRPADFGARRANHKVEEAGVVTDRPQKDAVYRGKVAQWNRWCSSLVSSSTAKTALAPIVRSLR